MHQICCISACTSLYRVRTAGIRGIERSRCLVLRMFGLLDTNFSTMRGADGSAL